MKRIGPGRVLLAGVVAFTAMAATGCPEAIYTLGRLPGAGNGDASTPDAQIGNDAQAASGGSGGMSGAGGIGGMSGTGGTGGTPTCSVRRETPERKGLNLYLMVDSSFGIVLQPSWPQMQQGIIAFVEDTSLYGLGVGIQFFGLDCDPAAYAMPDVAVAQLPGPTEQIRTAVLTTAPFMGLAAAVSPAAEGAVTYASAIEATDPTRESAVVFVTDGISDVACGRGLAEATTAIGNGFAATPSIETYVVAIATGLLPADLTPLNAMANAGGTQIARQVRVDLDAATEFHSVLKQIARDAEPCAFKVPQDFEAARTTLEWRNVASSQSENWPQVDNAAACGARRAVYLDENPDYLRLCPAACTVLKGAPDSRVRARHNCP